MVSDECVFLGSTAVELEPTCHSSPRACCVGSVCKTWPDNTHTALENTSHPYTHTHTHTTHTHTHTPIHSADGRPFYSHSYATHTELDLSSHDIRIQHITQ